MRVHLVAPHLTVPPGLAGEIERRLAALARRFDRPSCALEIELHSPVGAGKRRWLECRLRLRVPGGLLVVRRRGRTAREAFHEAARRLELLLDRWHDRLRWPPPYARGA